MSLAAPLARCRSLAAGLCLALLLMAPATAARASQPADARPDAGLSGRAALPVLAAALPLASDSFTWNQAWGVVRNFLINSRARLLQVATVGMFVALIIIVKAGRDLKK
jgi:hypothetical protein